jgi:alanine racemase
MWDEAVIMGRQGDQEITVRDVATLKKTVTYDVLTNWRLRLRRKAVNAIVPAPAGKVDRQAMA